LKKLIVAAFMLILMMIASTANAAEPVKILVNNSQIHTDTAPIVVKGRVLVPIRAVTESLGASVAWDQKTKTATVRKWSESVKLTVGKKIVSMEGNPNPSEEIRLEVPVTIVNNRVYIPLRFISQHFGYPVSWSNNTVFIHSPMSDKKRATLYTGGLADARKLLIYLSYTEMRYQNAPLKVTFQGEDYSKTVLFPEGDPMQRFLDHNLKDQRGKAPTINKNFFYFGSGFFGESNWEKCGRIDSDGKITAIGSKDTYGGKVVGENGTMTLELPDEKRMDAVN
jgi:hypothetical protein